MYPYCLAYVVPSSGQRACTRLAPWVTQDGVSIMPCNDPCSGCTDLGEHWDWAGSESCCRRPVSDSAPNCAPRSLPGCGRPCFVRWSSRATTRRPECTGYDSWPGVLHNPPLMSLQLATYADTDIAVGMCQRMLAMHTCSGVLWYCSIPCSRYGHLRAPQYVERRYIHACAHVLAGMSEWCRKNAGKCFRRYVVVGGPYWVAPQLCTYLTYGCWHGIASGMRSGIRHNVGPSICHRRGYACVQRFQSPRVARGAANCGHRADGHGGNRWLRRSGVDVHQSCSVATVHHVGRHCAHHFVRGAIRCRLWRCGCCCVDRASRGAVRHSDCSVRLGASRIGAPRYCHYTS